MTPCARGAWGRGRVVPCDASCLWRPRCGVIFARGVLCDVRCWRGTLDAEDVDKCAGSVTSAAERSLLPARYCRTISDGAHGTGREERLPRRGFSESVTVRLVFLPARPQG